MRTKLIAALLCTVSLLLPCAHAQQSETDRKVLAQLRAKAEAGDAQSQFELGAAFSLGKFGVPKDPVQAVKWFRQAAEQGNAAAQNDLGMSYQLGKGGMPRDTAEAVKWFCKAADQGCAVAQFNLGCSYEEGEGVTKDYAEAMKWFRKAADQGDAPAQYNIGGMYAAAKGVPRDMAEALKWWRMAAAQNHMNAQDNLGRIYMRGDGIPKDFVEAYKWFLLAAAQGHAAAKQSMTLLEPHLTREQMAEGQKRASDFKSLEVPLLDTQRHEPSGNPLADRRAKTATGDAQADVASGKALPAGKDGAVQDNAEAVKWFSHPDKQKQPSSDRAKDVAEASKWYLLALRSNAAAGNVEAQNALGEAFYGGKLGAVKNAVEAVRWFRMAAGQNLAAAQSNLGTCYERGEGVPKYEVEAYKWYLLASAQGDTKAKRNATLLELLLSPEEIAEGKRRAQAWLEQRKATSLSPR